jgi:predicted nucleic acid-binding protein
MNALVLDASATANFLLPDENNAYGEEVLRRIELGGALVPALWNYEIGNLLTMAVLRRRIDEAYRSIAISQLLHLPLTYWDGGGRGSLIHASQIAGLADEHKLTFYDATYLYLAKSEKLPLATLDGTLRAAADACGIQVIGTGKKKKR